MNFTPAVFAAAHAGPACAAALGRRVAGMPGLGRPGFRRPRRHPGGAWRFGLLAGPVHANRAGADLSPGRRARPAGVVIGGDDDFPGIPGNRARLAAWPRAAAPRGATGLPLAAGRARAWQEEPDGERTP